MLDSPVIEVAIGLTFVFLMLSLCATAVVEALVERRQWRGRLLHAKLRNLLGDDIVMHFYLERRVTDLATGVAPAGRRFEFFNKPWNLELPLKFTATSRREALQLAARMNAARLPSHIPEDVVADVFLDWLQGTGLPEGLRPGSTEPTQVPPRLAELWDRMNRRADGDQVRLRQELVAWFKNCTDRASGDFKRRIRLTLYLVGALLVVALNADTFRIATNLYQNPQLRSQLVAAAEHVNRTCTSGSLECAELRGSVNSAFRSTLDGTSTGIIGWQGWPERLTLTMLGGLVLTVLAIGLGADFWFGALKRIVSVRDANRAGAGGNEVSAQNISGSSSPASSHVESRAPLDIEAIEVAGIKGFQPYRFAESDVHAFWLAQFSSLAYSSETDLRGSRLMERHGLDVKAIEQKETQAFVFRNPNVCIVAFRGTEQKMEDFITDVDFIRQEAAWEPADPALKIHRGFRSALDAVWPELLDELREVQCPIWFTGHSLGGALAVLAGYRLHDCEPNGHTVAGVYTFGQPRVANTIWANGCSRELSQRIFRYVNSSDIVPLVPPSKVHEYQHVGHVRYFDASGRLHHERTLWERIAEQMIPVLGRVAAGDGDWVALAKKHTAQRIADHGMARYLECLERVEAVRALWRAPRQSAE